MPISVIKICRVGLLLFCLGMVSTASYAQGTPYWDILSRVSFDSPRGMDRTYESPQPIFSDAILVLEGEEVTLKGYIYPLESKLATQHFILSANPLNACYFCQKAGPETVIEIHSKFLIQYTRKPIKMRGRFKIKSADPMGILYELHDAEQVR